MIDREHADRPAAGVSGRHESMLMAVIAVLGNGPVSANPFRRVAA
jgi:hypothetical protein